MNKQQKELERLMEEMRQEKELNTVKGEFPPLKRSFTYRESTVIYPHDLIL